MRKSALQAIEVEWSAIQIKIESLEISDEIEQTQVRITFEDDYYTCAELINKGLRQMSSSEVTTNVGEHSQSRTVNLPSRQINFLAPKIEIPPFDGNSLEWHSFRDSFQTMIHDDEGIPAVQKFQLLKNLLRGDAFSMIASLNASEENYKVAWDLLKKRCERPRQIF